MNYKEIINNLKELVYSGEDIQKICDYIILWAVLDWASDIHIEPLSSYVRLRYRVDWELREILEYQNFLHQWIIARFKILADLKIDTDQIDKKTNKIIQKWIYPKNYIFENK